MEDPSVVLGIGPDASAEDIARAYRELAKRFHPDVAGPDAVPRMAEINAAYDLLREALVDAQRDRLRAARARAPRPRGPGWWLTREVRERLGSELLAALEPQERVLLTTDAATWDSHEVRLALTDRRFLWLRDDAISDRVRSQRYTRTVLVDGRLRRPLRRVGELRVFTDTGRRLSFSELRPDALEALLAELRGRVGVQAA